ncbi:patatin-like phospholipase family protein [Hyphobacterium sp.]|uniref:patatin-like phospholipase family protein n=1 Tax=Hyphobacterium sp. TaxID=2004662 RepID=UPI003BA97B38
MERLIRVAITLIVFLIVLTTIANIFIAINMASDPWRILNWGVLFLILLALGYLGWNLVQELSSPVRHKPKPPNINFWTADEVPLTSSNRARGVSFGNVSKGSILCVSGGGYKSGLFNLGSIAALNERGMLRTLDTISSVSGGSFTIAWLAIHWDQLKFDEDDVAINFDEVIVEPLIRKYTSVTIDTPSILRGVRSYALGGPSAGEYLSKALRKHFYGDTSLSDIPDPEKGKVPNFCFNSSDLRTSTRWTFSKEDGQPQAQNYKIGTAKQNFAIADVVTGSAAFPPFFSPFCLKLDDAPVHDDSRKAGKTPWIDKIPDHERPHFLNRMELGDGGIYGNMGVEEAKGHRLIFISNAGDPYGETNTYDTSWLGQMRQLIRHYHRQIEQRRKIHAVDLELLYTATPDRENIEVAIWQIEDFLSEDMAALYGAPIRADLAHKVATFPVRLKRADKNQADLIYRFGRAHGLREIDIRIHDGKTRSN